MLANILVPLDGTPESNAALPLARTVAQATGGSITLLRVIKPEHGTPFAEASIELQRVARELAGAGPSVKSVAYEGDDVARAVLEQIQRQSTDLVIMRTHGRAGLERAVLGSVTQQVVARGRVPVMVLRPGDRTITQIRKLLVPIDGSPGGTLALGTAVQLSKSTGASLQLLEVAQPASNWLYAGDAYGGMSYYDPTWDDEALASARTYVEGVVKRLRAAGVEADGDARQVPSVAEGIVHAADAANADVIVMSTRALTGPARAVLGSTADAVVRTAHCPVLLVHRGSEAEETATEFEPQAVTQIEPARA